MIPIGKTIWLVRSVLGISQSHLAKAIGISVPYLSLLESGKRPPSVPTLQKLEKELGLPRGLLLVIATNDAEHYRFSNKQSEMVFNLINDIHSSCEKLMEILGKK